MHLNVNNISFSYKNKQVLHGVSFEARPAEITAVIGANAAGKSTLIKSIIGINQAQGEICFDQKKRHQYSKRDQTQLIGYLTQENATPALLTVFEVVLLGRVNSVNLHVPQDVIDKVWAVMESMGLDKLATRMFTELSGGQRKIVSIAQTLVREPAILLMDEPTANLDIHNQLFILELIRNYTRTFKTTTILTLHDLNMVARFADHVVVLKHGYVYCTGTPREIFTEKVMREAYYINAKIDYDENDVPMINPISSTHEHSPIRM